MQENTATMNEQIIPEAIAIIIHVDRKATILRLLIFAKNTPRNAEGTTENGGYKREYSNRGYGTNYYPSPRYPQARDHRSYYGRDSYTPKNDMAYEAGPAYQEGGESAPMGYPRQSYSSYRRPSMDRRFGHGPIKSRYTKPHKHKPLNPNPKEVIR